MMNLNQWAIRHRVSLAALTELRQMFGTVVTDATVLQSGFSEAAVQGQIRVDASKIGWRLFRNNVGAVQTEAGFLRYGLANETKAMNTSVKSSDLIGIRPVVILPEHVGHTLGQFVALEVKRGGWTYSGTSRELAQLKFMELIISLGGYARFANSSEGLK